MSDANETKLGMSLDDIIKANKKGGKGGATPRGRGGRSMRGRGAKTSFRGAKTSFRARQGVRTPAAGARRQAKPTQRVQKVTRGGVGLKLGNRRRQNIATKFGMKMAQRRQQKGSVATTNRLVNRLVKRALINSSRLGGATPVRGRRNLSQIVAAASNRRAQRGAIIGRSTRGRTTATLTTGRGRRGRNVGGRAAQISTEMRQRLGWTGARGARRGVAQAGRTTTVRGRGVAGGTHMDIEMRQRNAMNRLNTQRAARERVIAGRRQRQQQQQQQPIVNARNNIRRGRGGRIGGGNVNNAADFIRNTVYRAMAEASVGLMGAGQFGGSGRGGRRGMVRGGRSAMSGSRMRMDNMHDNRASFDRIQSRPMRQQNRMAGFDDGRATMGRSDFVNSNTALTLDQRFGGSGGRRVGVTNPGRQFFF